MPGPTITKTELSTPELRVELGRAGDSTKIGSLSELSAAQSLAQINSDLDFFASLEAGDGSRSSALLGLDQALQPGATGLASRRIADFRFDDPDATIVMSHEHLKALIAQSKNPNLEVPTLRTPPISLFGVLDQRLPMSARLLSGASQVYGPRQPTPLVNWFGIEGIFGETLGTDLYRVEGYGKDTGIRTEQDVQRVMNDLQASMKPEEWKSVEFLFSSAAASRARIMDLRAKVAVKLEGRCESIKQAREAVFDVLKSEGTDLRALDQNGLVALLSNPDVQSGGRVFEQAYARFKTNFGVVFDLILQILPDNIPVYRGIETAYMGGANRDGKSYWGVGDVGLNVARSYGAANEGQDVRVIQTTLGELRSRGVIKPDHVAILGNAIEFFHGPDGLGGTTVVPYRVVE